MKWSGYFLSKFQSWGLLVLLVLCGLSLVSCTSIFSAPAPASSSTTSGSGGTLPTPTSTPFSSATSITYNTPGIIAAIAMQGGIANVASVIIETDTQAVTNANITLTGPSLSLPLTLMTSATSGGYYLAAYNSVPGWSYVANTNYTMTVSYGGKTFQASITSVGNVSFTPGSSGLTISWAGGGNVNTATALCYTPAYYSYTYGPPSISSPYFISQSGLAGYTGGNYNIQMNANETKTSAFNGGAYMGSSFSASDQESTTY